MAEICHLNRELLQNLYDKLNGGLFYENHDEDMALVGQLRLALAATPKTPRLAIMTVAQQVVDALEADRKSEGYDLEAGMFGPAFSNLMCKWAALEYAAQPAIGRADFATEAEGDAFILGWFEGQGWGFPSPRDESTISNAVARLSVRGESFLESTRKTCEVPTLDEAIRQAHWAHWAAEEHHVVAVSVRHLRLLANHNDAATPQAAAQPPAPGEAAREYMTGYSDCKEWAQPSQAVELSDEEQVALLRFNETCEDGQGYDVKTSMMSRLAEIGVVSRKFGSVYFVTEYGQRVIAAINAKGSAT